MRTGFTPAELTALRNLCAPINTVDPDRLDEFHRILDGCEDPALLQLAGARIKFLSKQANNVCIRRGIAGVETEAAKLDELPDSYDSHLAEKEREHYKRLNAEEQERAEAYDGASHEDDLIRGEWESHRDRLDNPDFKHGL
jgi:hypothetical protein